MQINYGPWILETDNCEAVIPPDWDIDVGGETGSETGGDGGDGDPVEDSCEPVYEIGEDICSLDSIGLDTNDLDTNGSGGSGVDEEDSGDCFLTTAIVERRGIEAGRRADPDRAAPFPRRLHDENAQTPGDGRRILRDRAPHCCGNS